MSDSDIVEGVQYWTDWWIEQRKKKLVDELSGTMSLNPFIVPFLFDYHNLDTIDEFVDLVLASHLMIGHNTGFGKLIDEKILPGVFGTIKLDKKYRNQNPPLENSSFNEIDHIVNRPDGSQELLSLKAGKWTIQLSMAIQLNRSFSDILQYYGAYFSKIVVGVYYGNNEGLTDKYDILRGINRGATHHVQDITSNVKVFAGEKFWTWLGNGNKNTQNLVLQGITSSVETKNIKEDNKILMDRFKETIGENFKDTLGQSGSEKWNLLLEKINSSKKG